MKEFIKMMDKQNKKNVSWKVLWIFMLIMFVGALHPTVDTGRKKAIALLIIASLDYFIKYFYIFSEKRSKSGKNKRVLKDVFTIFEIADKNDVIPDIDIIDVMKHHAFDLKEYMNILRKRMFCVSIISAFFIALYGLGMKIKYNSFSKYFLICIIIIAFLPTVISYLFEFLIKRYLYGNRSYKKINVFYNIFFEWGKMMFVMFTAICYYEFLEKTTLSMLCSRNLKGDNSFLFCDTFGLIGCLLFGFTICLYTMRNLYLDSRKIYLRITIVLFILCMIYLYGNRGYYQDGKFIIYKNFLKSEYTKDDFSSVEISDEDDDYDYDFVKLHFSGDDSDYISIPDSSIVLENEFGTLVKSHGGVTNKKKIQILSNLKKEFADKKRSGEDKSLD